MPQEVERVVRGDPEALREDALGVADHVAGHSGTAQAMADVVEAIARATARAASAAFAANTKLQPRLLRRSLAEGPISRQRPAVSHRPIADDEDVDPAGLVIGGHPEERSGLPDRVHRRLPVKAQAAPVGYFANKSGQRFGSQRSSPWAISSRVTPGPSEGPVVDDFALQQDVEVHAGHDRAIAPGQVPGVGHQSVPTTRARGTKMLPTSTWYRDMNPSV